MWYWAGPAVLSAVLRVPPDFPGGARMALVAGWFAFLPTCVALWSLLRRLTHQPPVDFTAPPALTAWLPIPHAWRSWVLGGVAITVGYVISTTIFR